MTITNRSFGAGTYAVGDLGGLVSDISNGPGRIIVIPPALYVDDTGVMEGASGTTTNALFQIRLINVIVPVTFDYFTVDGTATSGIDYVSTNGSLTIPAGITQTNISVAVIGDDWIEPNETFQLVVTNVVGTVIAKSSGICTITNDDARTISINATSVSQPASGTTSAVFSVTLSQAIGTDVNFAYDTLDGSATVADGDYVQVSGGTGTITAGQTTTNIAITVNGDNSIEGIETFNVVLRNPSANATLGTSTGTCSIINNNGPPVLSITNLVSVMEGNSGTTNAVFTVWLSRPPASRVAFQFDTQDGTAITNDLDYVGVIGGAGVLEVGQLQTNIAIQVNGDLKVEPTERFYVILSNPSNAVILNAATGACDIVNDDFPFVWSGASSNALASNTNNWRWNGAPATRLPTNTDDVLLDSTSSSNLTWNAGSNGLSATVANWRQTVAYTGTVTVQTVYGASGFTNFAVSGDCMISNGVWMHLANPIGNTAVYRLAVTVGGAFTLGTNALISVDARGFQGGDPVTTGGPGAGAYDQQGPGHGGQGGYQQSYTSATTYGSAFHPVTLGSGGRTGGGTGTGGGAVQFTVGGAAQIDGSILARSSLNGFPGAGGSIFITAGSVSGSGTLDAQAGNGPCGGGGGRIAVVLTNGATFGSLAMRANGGVGGSAGLDGGAGTIYRQTMSQTQGQGTLTIDNNGNTLLTYAVTEPAEALNLNALQALMVTNGGMFSVITNTTLDFATANIQGGGELKIRSTNLVSFPTPFVVTNIYRLCLDAPVSAVGDWVIMTNAVMTHSPNYYLGPNPEHRINLTLAGNLTITAGGAIDVNDRGYANSTGPGAGIGDTINASHGGRGSSSGGPTATYGSVLQPITLGSGNITGGPRNPGAGAVVLSVTGLTTIDGAIRANTISGGRCAAGGAVFITTGTLGGSGTVDASAGTSDLAGAGGGRIAMILTSGTSSGSVVLKSYGGDGGGTLMEGAAGTIYKQTAINDANGGTVLIDNNNLATNGATFTPLPAFASSIENLKQTQWTAQNKGKIGLVTNVTIAGLTLNANSYLELAGCTGMVKSLVITNHVFRSGSYAASDLGGLVTDSSGGNGRVIVNIMPGMLLIFQ